MAQSTSMQFSTDQSDKIAPETRNPKFAPNAAPMHPDKVSEMNMETEGAPPKINSDLIAARAYEIWEKTGRKEGSDIKNWLQAEEELRNRTTEKSLR